MNIMPIFSALCANFGRFSDITLVFVVITFPLTSNLKIIIYPFIWYRFQIHLKPSTDPQDAIFVQKYNTFMTCSQPFDTLYSVNILFRL